MSDISKCPAMGGPQQHIALSGQMTREHTFVLLFISLSPASGMHKKVCAPLHERTSRRTRSGPRGGGIGLFYDEAQGSHPGPAVASSPRGRG